MGTINEKKRWFFDTSLVQWNWGKIADNRNENVITGATRDSKAITKFILEKIE